jgi:hypothetical protein
VPASHSVSRPFRRALAHAGLVWICASVSLAGQPPAPPPQDPAAVFFDADVGVLLVPVKSAATDDYEAVILELQAALARTADPVRRAQAAGWRVFKAAEADAKGQALYVHLIAPVVTEADYRPSAVLDELLDGAPEELLVRYRDAHAGPPSKLTLTEFANMAKAPAAPRPD